MKLTKSQRNKMNKFLESYQNDISEEIAKAQRDAVIYGEGIISMIADGSIKHIPYKKFKNGKT